MYEESLRMPLIVRWPGVVKPGSENKDLVQNLDFAATFLDAAGQKVPGDMQGHSLKPLLEGKRPEGLPQINLLSVFRVSRPAQRRQALRSSYRPAQTHSLHASNEWELFGLQT
jgi:arylsulfatase A-like enzyme